MTKRKHPEEDTIESEPEVVENPIAAQSEEVEAECFVDGWTIGEETTEDSGSTIVIQAETDSEGEDG